MQAYNISEYDVLKGGKIYSHLIGKYFEESQNDLERTPARCIRSISFKTCGD